MGQRHQIYCKIPYEFQQMKDYDFNEASKGEKVPNDIVALHHQWLYGFGPLLKLKQFLDFFNKGIKNPYFVFGKDGLYQRGNVENALQSLYSLDFDTGDYSGLSILTNMEAKNPLCGDNNDGISIIDVSDSENPKYAFMHFADWRGVERLKPLTAEQYVRSYYNESHYKDNEVDAKEVEDIEKEISVLVSYFDNVPLLTERECELLFPSMFVKGLFE